MARGTVKWFNSTKGFGIMPQDGGRGVFVHIVAARGAELRWLNEGQAPAMSSRPGGGRRRR